MFNILVVEDDQELLELFCSVLSDNGYNPIPASDSEKSLKLLESNYVDLIISDVMMPGVDGFELVKQIRESKYTTPILLVTAKGSIKDKEKGFKAGTDDYMVKPIDINEMLWRIEALLRRSQAVKDRVLTIGQTTFDCNTLTVSNENTTYELPQKEFFLIFKLVSSIGKIFTRVQLFNEIWGISTDTDMHTLDVHINRLREKLKNNNDIEIVTIRGLGYKAVKKQ